MPPTTPKPTPNPLPPHPLEWGAGLASLLFAAVLPWTIAPMGVATALCAALPLALVLRGAPWPRTPVGHYMTFAGQLLLFTSLAAGVAMMARERRWRMLALAVLIVGGAALAATYTRSSWLGLAVALTVAVAVARPRWLPALLAVVVLA